MIEIDLRKQQALDADPRAIQKIDLDRTNNTRIFFILEEAKKSLRLFPRSCKNIVNML